MEIKIITNPSLSDWQAVIALHNEIFSKFPGFTDYSAEIAVEKMKDAKEVAIIEAGNGELLVGYAMCYERYDGFWHMWQMGVLEDFRGQGIATGIYEAAEKYAREKGLQGITLNTFNSYKDNLRLALKRGFSIYDLDKSGEHNANPKILLKLTF